MLLKKIRFATKIFKNLGEDLEEAFLSFALGMR